MKQLRELFLFVVLGLLVAAPGEILNQVLARHDWTAFRSTLLSYALLLPVAFLVGRLISAVVKTGRRAAVIHYLLFGTLGLAVEWFLLGNAPVADPFQVVTQPGMFTYWGTLVLGPRLLMDPTTPPSLRRSFLRYFVIFSSLYLLVAIVIPKDRGGIFFGFVIFAAGTAALNYFYLQYFRVRNDRV